MEKEMKKRIQTQLKKKERKLFCEHNNKEVCEDCKKKIEGDVSELYGDVSRIKGDVAINSFLNWCKENGYIE
jgi:hypothetical protein